MREQVQIPIGGKGEESEQEKSSAPKGLNRPAMPQGLEKPRPMAKKRVWMRRSCSCGSWECGSPGHGRDGHDWIWRYFDPQGVMIDATEHGLPLRGWEGGDRSGFNSELDEQERSDFWSAYGDRLDD